MQNTEFQIYLNYAEGQGVNNIWIALYVRALRYTAYCTKFYKEELPQFYKSRGLSFDCDD